MRVTKSQNIYEYKKVKVIDNDGYSDYAVAYSRLKVFDCQSYNAELIKILTNKINELIAKQNRLAKDLELYKKAYKRLHHLVQGVTND